MVKDLRKFKGYTKKEGDDVYPPFDVLQRTTAIAKPHSVPLGQRAFSDSSSFVRVSPRNPLLKYNRHERIVIAADFFGLSVSIRVSPLPLITPDSGHRTAVHIRRRNRP